MNDTNNNTNDDGDDAEKMRLAFEAFMLTGKKPPTEEKNNDPSSSCATSTLSTKSKKKKKKKKSNAQTALSPEEAQKSPSKSNQQNSEDTTDKTDNANSNSETSNSSSKPNNQKLKITLPKPSQMSTLQKAFLERLTSSRFRELNEELYTHSSQHAFEHFTQNPELFDQYHVGFRKQAKEWPSNPVDVIYKKIVNGWKTNGKKKNEKGEKTNDTGDQGRNKKVVVVADFGCGDAKLAERLLALQIGKDGLSLTTLAAAKTKKKKPTTNNNNKDEQQSSCPFTVHSFDLVSGGNPLVTPADMCNVPLPKESVDVAVYSLALMGTNVADFVREAWRVLRFNGVLRVAEVRSRFETAATAVDAADTKNGKGGGGKRGKLNNGKKNFSNKKTKTTKANGTADSSSPPQPLMLLDEFIALMERCGFQCTNMDRSNKMFLFMDFVKVDGSKGLSAKERFTAKPCIYKRR
mmetsp:Transcript_24040/g.51896  ORF Transcript_24040/g.51896 Transcript_24040/m.51896 type:complete len:463 (+) Transcript_24040:473-1861(+)